MPLTTPNFDKNLAKLQLEIVLSRLLGNVFGVSPGTSGDEPALVELCNTKYAPVEILIRKT